MDYGVNKIKAVGRTGLLGALLVGGVQLASRMPNFAGTEPGRIALRPAEPQPIKRSGLLTILTHHGKRYLLCRVDLKHYQIDAYNQQAGAKGAHTFASLARLHTNAHRELVLAMNGGMFEPNQRPTGLLVADGQTLAPLNMRHGDPKKVENFYDYPARPGQHPNGVFGIDHSGRAYIVPSDRFPAVAAHARVATQSGPLLVQGGDINRCFEQGFTSVFIRNGVGVTRDDHVQLVISKDPVSLPELASFFSDALHCSDALYLDGVVCQYYAPEQVATPWQAQPLGVFLTVSRPMSASTSPAPTTKLSAKAARRDRKQREKNEKRAKARERARAKEREK